jgi:arginase
MTTRAPADRTQQNSLRRTRRQADTDRHRIGVLGVPVDGSGAFRGVELLPAALRNEELVQRLSAADLGNVQAVIADPTRDATTGIVGYVDALAATTQIADRVANAISQAHRLLVLGGDCGLLIGVFAGLQRAGLEPGLACIDGHFDSYTGCDAPSGEWAEMEIAALLGYSALAVSGEALLAPSGLVMIGPRDGADARSRGARTAPELSPLVKYVSPHEVRTLGAAEIALRARGHLERRPLWVHFDADVISTDDCPAVEYPEPGQGLNWSESEDILRVLWSSPDVIGASVGVLNPRLDPDGDCVTRLADTLVNALGRAPRRTPQ